MFDPLNDIPNFKESNIPTWNDDMINNCIMDLFINHRKKMHERCELTEQTAHIKIGYVGQHLASVLLNTKGCKTAARGDDCMDKSEVKSCSRVDQSDKCNRCSINLSKFDKVCQMCRKGDKIKRNNDSKWLLTIRSEEDLKKYLDLERLILILEEYPNFKNGNFDDIVIKVYEIYPKKDICKNFKKIITNYYNNTYLKNKEKNPKKVPAPKNLWPDSFQFYMCNPVKIFESKIKDYMSNPVIERIHYIKPDAVRTTNDIEVMPLSLLTQSEKDKLNLGDHQKLSYIDVLKLDLRDV